MRSRSLSAYPASARSAIACNGTARAPAVVSPAHGSAPAPTRRGAGGRGVLAVVVAAGGLRRPALGSPLGCPPRVHGSATPALGCHAEPGAGALRPTVHGGRRARATPARRGYQCATVMVPRDPSHPGRGDHRHGHRPHAGHRAQDRVAAGQPGRSRRVGVDCLPSLVAADAGSPAGPLRRRRLRPAGSGPHRPDHLPRQRRPRRSTSTSIRRRPPRPASTPCWPRTGPSPPGCEAAAGPTALRQHRRRGPGHGRAAGRAGRQPSSPTWASPTAPSWARPTPSCSRPRCGPWCSTAPSTRPCPVIAELDQQSASLEEQLQQFFCLLRRNSSCPWKPAGSPTAAFEALLAEVRTNPLPGAARPARSARPSCSTARRPPCTRRRPGPTWPRPSQDASHGDGTTSRSSSTPTPSANADGSYSNLFEANAAVNCLDAPAPTLAQIEAAAPAAEAAAPVFGLQNLYGEAGCSVWPVPATGRVGPIHAAGSPPIVVVGSTGDPVTPYRWAQSLAAELSHGVLLTRVGDGHTGYRVQLVHPRRRRRTTSSTSPCRRRPGSRCPTQLTGTAVDAADRAGRCRRRLGRLGDDRRPDPRPAGRPRRRPGPGRADRAGPVPAGRLDDHRARRRWCASRPPRPRWRPPCASAATTAGPSCPGGRGPAWPAGPPRPATIPPVVIVTTKMNRILEVDAEQRLAWVQPGVLNLDLSQGGGPPRPALRPRPLEPAVVLGRAATWPTTRAGPTACSTASPAPTSWPSRSSCPTAPWPCSAGSTPSRTGSTCGARSSAARAPWASPPASRSASPRCRRRSPPCWPTSRHVRRGRGR